MHNVPPGGECVSGMPYVEDSQINSIQLRTKLSIGIAVLLRVHTI